ncbi:S9 family peptidase [Opitutaceae bacterium EW11]|nr:S9 family peptidase [Opitutaceae bacterium EW11]
MTSGLFAAALPPPPESPKRPVTDEYHGVKVVDDYRWLEKSPSDPEVRRWIDAQNTRTRAYIDALPNKASVTTRLSELIRSTSVSYALQVKRGGKLFALKTDPKFQQPTLVTLASPDDPASEKTLVDPNQMDAKGSIAIDWFVVSLDGKRVGVSLSSGGSEDGDLYLYDVESAKEIGEVVPHVQNGTAGGSIAFTPDSAGFWYTRYPRGNERPPEDAGFYQQVWFHTLGTAADKDTYELGKDLPKIAEIQLHTKEDGRWLLAEVKNGDGGDVEYFLRSTAPDGKWIPVTTFDDKVYLAEFGEDDALYLVSRKGALRGRILRLDLHGTPALKQAEELVPESDGAVEGLLVTASRLYVDDLLGGPSRVRVYDLGGKRLADLPIPPVSSVRGLVRLEGDDIVFETVTFINPPAWFRYDAHAAKATKTALAVTSLADYSDCEVLREFAVSKDGTKIPLNIIRKRGTRLDGRNPTLLYAYGGYGISQKPAFSAHRRLWLDHGGVWVVANLRGGSEYGDDWHLQGNLLKKQNVFDDFYACGIWLVDHDYTSPEKLAIMGGSNGGLLMGATLTQHPEMCRAVASLVGVYDMLRVELTSNGAFNVTEYGTVKDPAQFRALHAYSPYHHVVDGVKYPSILLTTGANDPRVEPWNSRKFAARLQAASASGNPILLRTSFSAGHGMGSALDEIIAERSDVFAFLLHEVGAP